MFAYVSLQYIILLFSLMWILIIYIIEFWVL